VPLHLRSTGYSGAGDLGHGEGYVYPHDHSLGVVPQQYFPDGVDPTVIFRPGDHGDEKAIVDRLAKIDKILGRKGRAD
jgi:putative ATPase